MKLTAFKYGTTEITEKMAFQDGNGEIKLPISLMFFMIEQGDRKILVDVGCDTMPGFELYEFRKPIEVLEACGTDHAEITDIIITHAHHDHIDALKYYPKAQVFLHKEELADAQDYIQNCSALNVFEGDTVICEGVEIKHIGGHKKGSCIVLVRTGTKTFVLCGDECYTRENLIYKKPTGSSCCPDKSIGFVEEYSKDIYVPILFHDPLLVEQIGCKTIADDCF